MCIILLLVFLESQLTSSYKKLHVPLDMKHSDILLLIPVGIISYIFKH